MISGAASSTLGYTYLFGVLWGIGGLTYGLGVRYLGVSLGSSIILGLCMVFGALIPAIYYDFVPTAGKDTFSEMASSQWGLTIMAGLLLCVVGIVISGKAGMMKEKQLCGAQADPHGTEVKMEYKFGLGMFVSIVSGVLSACFNFGLEAGQELATVANDTWKAANPGEGSFYTGTMLYMLSCYGADSPPTLSGVWC
jgi:L-rhamnose-H+ transport protein